MMNTNNLKSKEKKLDLTIYKHFRKIESIKELKNFKSISNISGIQNQFLASNIEMIFLFYQLSKIKQIIYLSENIYLAQNKHLTFIYSQKPINNILLEQHYSSFGNKLIKIMKSMYKRLYNLQNAPPVQFTQFADFVMDNEHNLQNDEFQIDQLISKISKMKLILKYNLKARVHNNLILNRVNNAFSNKLTYQQLILQDCKLISSHKHLSFHQYNKITFNKLLASLKLFTQDRILIYPAKITIDSRQDGKTYQINNNSNKYFIIHISTLKYILYRCNLKVQSPCKVDNKKQFCLADQITFSLTQNKNIDDQIDSVSVKLQTQNCLTKTNYIFFQQIFNSIVQRYRQIYMIDPFLSSFGQNITKIRIKLRKKDQKIYQLDFIHQIPYLPNQSFIGTFIKVIDMMLILYLVLQKLLINLQDQQYLQNMINAWNKKDLQKYQKQIVQQLYYYSKIYLQEFMDFKRLFLRAEPMKS